MAPANVSFVLALGLAALGLGSAAKCNPKKDVTCCSALRLCPPTRGIARPPTRRASAPTRAPPTRRALTVIVRRVQATVSRGARS